MALYEMIKDIEMFQNFTEEERKTFSEMEHSMLGFNEGDVIIKEGDQCSSLFLLVTGKVKITKEGVGNVLSELKPGDIFGEMSFFTKKPRHSSVIAAERVMTIKMNDSFFRKVTPEIRDKIKNYIIERLISRLDTMNESLIKIARYAKGNILM